MFESTRTAFACAFVVTAVVCLAAVGTAPAAATSSSPAAVYVGPNGEARVLYANGSTTSTGVGASVVGPMANFDDDGRLEAPVVDGSGTLRLVDTAGETRTLVSGDVASSKTYLPSGDWDGDGRRAVFYENTNDGKLYRVEPGESPEPVVGPDGAALATNGPVGFADYDDDGDDDVVYLGSSSTVKYYDGESVGSTGFSSFGANNGIGIGAPADLDGDGTPRVPYVTGSNNLALLAADGTKTKLTPNYGGASKAPVAAVDWRGDASLELLHVNADNGEVYYATLSGSVGAVESASGGTVTTTVAPGVAPAVAPPGPRIDDFAATNPAGRNVTVEFTSSDPLTDIAVEVTGPESFTLTEADFAESGDGPYRYAATTTVSADGTYTATLTRAENADGVDGSDGQQDSVTVETEGPTVTAASLAGDGDGVVGDGDEVRVSASVEGAPESVTADASAFGAGTVSLRETADGYAARFTVDGGSATAGNASVRVTATGEYGTTDSATTGSLFVDLQPPTANAGADRTVAVGTTANFDAADSTDNSRLTAYSWTFGDGATATGVTASHTYDEPGTYEVSLTVTDAAGLSDTDTVVVTVTEDVTATAADGTRTAADGTRTAARRTGGSGGGDAPPPADAETTAGSDVAVTTGPGESVTLEFANLAANQPVSADYRGVVPPNESAPVRGLRFVPERDGDVSVTLEGLDRPPEGVPALRSRTGVEALEYVRIAHSISNDRVHGVALTFVVPRDRLGNATRDAVTLYRYRNGSWTAHDATVVGETRRSVAYRARVPGLSVFAVGAGRSPVRVVSADLAETSVPADGTATVTAVVENGGDARATRRVSLVVDGSPAATRTVTLDPGERRTLAFDYDPPGTGTYRVAVEGVRAGTLSVGSGAVAAGVPEFRWLLVLAVAVLAFVAGYGVRRRRESPSESPLPDLPADQRRTLVAAYESGYFEVPRSASLDELARRLDVSEQTVSTRLRHGLDALLAASLTGDAGAEAETEAEAGEPSGPDAEPASGGDVNLVGGPEPGDVEERRE
ncbi:MAG: PKD domain-containing protein [Haloferacaceae archaeon]